MPERTSRAVRAAVPVAAWLLAAPPAPAAAVGPGDPAPDFTLAQVDGTTRTLSDYRGQVVLLALIGYG